MRAIRELTAIVAWVSLYILVPAGLVVGAMLLISGRVAGVALIGGMATLGSASYLYLESERHER